ncbi:hypothetical protein C8Q79DRAFT_172047 [Trametes meyenii]|nr:hypothetical protein C8Q79DRAFT_172047 [Trametes meyenii]
MALPPSFTPLLDNLRSTLSEKPPLCYGTLELSPQSFSLYYGFGDDARQVNLTSSSPPDALDALGRACEAATFGRNNEDVLDETYRKAGKLDVDKFMMRFDAEKSGLVGAVRVNLLDTQSQKSKIYAELYKLNVYGKDAFFKPHIDTPRGSGMFGSLVVVFPTPHEGGELVLRHDGKEWAFDAASLLSATQCSIAFAAFFSDVEHEVLQVTSGHRVTVTYNLYWATTDDSGAPTPGLTVIEPANANAPKVEQALAAFLDDPDVLPNGGVLGFGLRHAYPVPAEWEAGILNKLRGWLKGADAALFRACEALSLEPLLRLVHEGSERDTKKLIILEDLVDHVSDDWSVDNHLMYNAGGVRVFRKYFYPEPRAEKRRRTVRYPGPESRRRPFVAVHWVTERAEVNVMRQDFLAYGNEAYNDSLYVLVSLFVDVGPAGNRADISCVKGVAAAKGKNKNVYEGSQEEVWDEYSYGDSSSDGSG